MQFKARLFSFAVVVGALVLSAASRTPKRLPRKLDSEEYEDHGAAGGRLTVDNNHTRAITWPAQKPSRQSPGGGLAIHPIHVPFLQSEGDWDREGKGILFSSLGEPKSGTTWTAKVITSLAINLCGSSTNPWCKMGGLKVIPRRPASSYEFEMIETNTSNLFMHFSGNIKHNIPGLDIGHGCNPSGRPHINGFEVASPCLGREQRGSMTQAKLKECLPDTSRRCAQYLPQDPAVRRIAVVFRDPRNLVISEHKMRVEVYHMAKTSLLDLFIHERLETIVSWMHQRWIWHTTSLGNVSHVMFYEDLKENALTFVTLAEFMGLDCSQEQAHVIWEANRYDSPPGAYNSYGLPTETIEWMNVTMARLLPEPMLARIRIYDKTGPRHSDTLQPVQ